MNSRIIGLLAETSVHPGQGKQQGIIDQPVAREAWTDYPFIPGSGMKGAFREKAQIEEMEGIDVLFGTTKQAGLIGFSDARLLLLPVRSLNSHYFWVTCPYLLERFLRDLNLIGETTKLSKHDWSITQNLALVHPQSTIDKQIYLEEFDYRTVKADPLAEYVRLIEPLIFHPFVRQRLPEQLVVIADREFHYFARFSLPIQSKNHLGENKASGNVWQEENLPADTLLYSLLMPRYADPFVEQFYQHLVSQPYLQVGGNESTGLGWFALQLWVREGAL